MLENARFRGSWAFRFAALFAAVVLLLPIAAAGDEPLYRLTDLQTLGGPNSAALAVNELGQVVGWSDLLTPVQAEPRHAFLWTPPADETCTRNPMQDLGTLGGFRSEARDINNLGMVVGVSDVANGDQHAFYWYDGHLFDVNDLVPVQRPLLQGMMRAPPRCTTALKVVFEINAINDAGAMVGCGLFWWDEKPHGLLLTPVQPFNPGKPAYDYCDLGALPGAEFCASLGISEKGQAVGVSGTKAYLWDPVRGMAQLDKMAVYSEGRAINAAGMVAGVAEDVVDFPMACVWQDEMRQPLGFEAGWIGEAFDLNDAGIVVGWSAPDLKWQPAATVWVGCVGYDLNLVTLIEDSNTKWQQFGEAVGINAAGAIVGTARVKDGFVRAYLLTPELSE